MFSRKDLARLIIPIIVEQVFTAAIGIAGVLMVSHVGEAAVSGVSLVDSINLLLINIFTALATGGAIVTAQYLGREDADGANRSARQLFLVTVLFAGVVMVASLAANRQILSLLYGGVEEPVMRSAQIYFYFSACSYPFIAAFNACSALFRAMNHPRVSMVSSILMNVVNITGNVVLIYGLGFGVMGAGISSLVARAFGAVFLYMLLRRTAYIVRLERFFPIRPEKEMIARILKIGVPNGLENGMFNIGKIMVQGIVTAFGTTAIAANAVAGNIASISMLAGSSVSMAAITVVGRCIGAGDTGQASFYIKRLTLISQGIVTAVYIAIVVFMKPLLGMYDLTPEGTELARQMVLCVAAAGVLFWSVSFVLPSGLRAANDVNFTMVIAIISMWVLRVGGGYLFSNTLGFASLGVWLGMGADWLFRAVVFTVRLYSGRWKTKRLM